MSFVPHHWPRALVLGFRRLCVLWPDPAGFEMTIMLVAVGVCSMRSWLPARHTSNDAIPCLVADSCRRVESVFWLVFSCAAPDP